MQKFVTRLKELLSEYHLNYQDTASESLLEILLKVFTEFNGLDNDVIRQDFNRLYTAMNGKSLREIDAVIDPVCELCRDHQKAGFVEGVKVGVRLAQEVDVR